MFVPLSANSQKVLGKRLIQAAIQREGNVSDAFFICYSVVLSKTSYLERIPDLVLHLLTPLIKNRHPSGIEWVANLLKRKPRLLSRYSPIDQVRDLHKWVNDVLEEIDSETTETHLQQIDAILAQTLKRKPR